MIIKISLLLTIIMKIIMIVIVITIIVIIINIKRVFNSSNNNYFTTKFIRSTTLLSSCYKPTVLAVKTAVIIAKYSSQAVSANKCVFLYQCRRG